MIYISQIIHRTLIEVGTRGMETASVPEPDAETLVTANHTFVFVVSDAKNGCILFSMVVDEFGDFHDEDVNDGNGEAVHEEEHQRRPLSRSRSPPRGHSSRSRSPSPRQRGASRSR